jgi:hypothetical protein
MELKNKIVGFWYGIPVIEIPEKKVSSEEITETSSLIIFDETENDETET